MALGYLLSIIHHLTFGRIDYREFLALAQQLGKIVLETPDRQPIGADDLKTRAAWNVATALRIDLEFEEMENVYTNPNYSTRTKQIQGPTWTHKPLEFYDETRIVDDNYNFRRGIFSIYEDGVQWVSNKGDLWLSMPYENIQHTQVTKSRYFFGLRKLNDLIIQLHSRKWESIYFANDNVEEIKQKVYEMWKNYLSNKAN